MCFDVSRKLRSFFLSFALLLTLSIPAFAQKNSGGQMYDPAAVVKSIKKGTKMSGYYVQVDTKKKIAWFYTDKKLTDQVAEYNLGQQFWVEWDPERIDPIKIELKAFYKKINLAKTILQRTEDGTHLANVRVIEATRPVKSDAQIQKEKDAARNSGYNSGYAGAKKNVPKAYSEYSSEWYAGYEDGLAQAKKEAEEAARLAAEAAKKDGYNTGLSGKAKKVPKAHSAYASDWKAGYSEGYAEYEAKKALAETPMTETPKTETPKTETSKPAETPKADESKTETPKQETTTTQTAQTGTSNTAENSSQEIFIYDPDAVITSDIRVDMVDNLYFLVTKDGSGYLRRESSLTDIAYYNITGQYWTRKPSSDIPSLPLKKLYKSIALSSETLDRKAPSANAVKKSVKEVGYTAGKEKEVLPPTNAKVAKSLEPFTYDKNAVIDYSYSGVTSGGFKAVYDTMSTMASFYKDGVSCGIYNLTYQYFESRTKGLDFSSYDFTKLYKKISLSKKQLNRDIPESAIFQNIALKDYDWTKDKDFVDFVNWMKAHNVPEERIEFYKQCAAVPAKRGSMVPFTTSTLNNEVGFNTTIIKDGAGNTIGTAGGMQAYFEARKNDRYFAGSEAIQKGIKTKGELNVYVLELIPSTNQNFTGKYTGTKLASRIKEILAAEFGSLLKINVTVKKVVVDYSNGSTQAYINQAGLSTGSTNGYLVCPYWADLNTLVKLGRRDIGGNYGTNYCCVTDETLDVDPILTSGTERHLMCHELGHSVGLMHHFSEEVTHGTDNGEERDTYFSATCAMNYFYTQDHLCELCRYAFWLDDKDLLGKAK
ncbi:MAG: hypothetical protein J6Y60_11820 [Treponema sp.]|nr:hypothetical protein [Treponema sp.]